MSPAAGRVFSGLLSRSAFCRRIFLQENTRLNSVRSLAQHSRTSVESTDDEKKVKDEPIKFSTSAASHRNWKVDRSLGSQFERPWWKVLPISLLMASFLLWCALRGESDIDDQLKKGLYEHLPGLLSEEEEEQNKTT